MRCRHRNKTLDPIQWHNRLATSGASLSQGRSKSQVIPQALGIDGLGCQALKDMLQGSIQKVGLIVKHRLACQENVLDEAGVRHDLLVALRSEQILYEVDHVVLEAIGHLFILLGRH